MNDASEPDSGGGRSTGRSKASKPGSSYAAIGLLKENMQAAISRRPGDSRKAVPEHESSSSSSSSALSGELSVNFKSFSIKSDLQQRTGPTKENALLRAELELVRGQNADLAARLQLAEGQLGQHNRQMLHSRPSSAGHEQELSSLQDALQDAHTQRASAQESMQATLHEVLLQPEELEAAALQCTWIAHYWELAHQFGLYPEVAASRTAYWQMLAPPTSAIVQSAHHVCRALEQRKERALCGDDDNSSSSSSSSSRAVPDWMSHAAGSGMFSSSWQATAADLVVIERGARQLQELGVEAAVLAALSQQAEARRSTLQLPPASQQGTGCQTALLSPEQAAELQLQHAYLAYLWGSAALMGLEPQVSVRYTEQWHSRIDKQPTVRDFVDVRRGFQVLRILGIEQGMWRRRHSCGGMHLMRLALAHGSDNTASSVAVNAPPPPVAGPMADAAEVANSQVAATAAAELIGGSVPEGVLVEPVQELLQLAPSLLPFGITADEGCAVTDSLSTAQHSMHINFGIMSMPALSFSGSTSGSRVPVLKASRAAGLRTG